MNKFVLLTAGRSGSEYLIRWLKRHPEVLAFGELLGNPKNELSIGNYFERRNQKVFSGFIKLSARYPWAGPILSCFMLLKEREYLNFVFSDYHFENSKYKSVKVRSKLKAQGFKIPYRHALMFWGIWKSMRKVKIIHLVRSNLLALHISRKVSKKYTIYHSNEPVEIPKIRLPIWSLKANLFALELSQRAFQFLIRRTDHLTLYYEDFFSDNRANSEAEILNFLCIGRFTSEAPPLKKTGSYSLTDRVENYEQVQRKLKDSRYKYCLDRQ